MFLHLSLILLSSQLLNGIPLNATEETTDADQRLKTLVDDYLKDTNATIEKIQEKLQSDPASPKLTREEITDILDGLSHEKNDRRKHQRALMLVMPYTSKDNNYYNIEELYTKPPITHLIDVKSGTTVTTVSTQKTSTETTRVTKPSTRTTTELRTTYPTTQHHQNIYVTPLAPQSEPPKKKYSNHRYPEDRSTTPRYSPPLSTIKMYSDFVPMTGIKSKPKPFVRYENPATYAPVYQTTHATSLPIDVQEAQKIIQDINILQPSKYNNNQYDPSDIVFTEPPQKETVVDSTGSTAMPDISAISDTLTPEMRDLLMSFGLIESPSEKASPFQRSSDPEIVTLRTDPMSYTQFKPLPDINPASDEMEEFLSIFGLRPDRRRSSKSIQKTESNSYLNEMPRINKDMLPESMHDILEDFGFSDVDALIDKESHIFNPAKTTLNEDEMRRLSHLLETIRKLEKLNRTIVQEDLMDLDIQNIKSLTKVLSGKATLDVQSSELDPVNFDTGLEKNQVKRQENTTTQTPTTKATIEEPSTQSYKALEESFGGEPSDLTKSTTEESLPPPRRTGFYYLVDWNSFLEVGEEDKDRVKIRFSPQAGDPNRFYRVNVP